MTSRGMTLGHRFVALVVGVLWAPCAGAQIVNPGFDTDLAGWAVTEHAGGMMPGAVVWDAGAARLEEGDSQLVFLAQRFALDDHPSTLSLDVDLSVGFDVTSGFFPDVFEAYLLDDDALSVVDAWEPDAGAFFTLREDGTWSAASGVSYDGLTVTLDVSGLQSGQEVTLVFGLVGADGDAGSVVRVDGLALASQNLPPIADAGGDLMVSCDADAFVLDGGQSYDPHGDPIFATWTDEDATVLGTDFVLDIDPPFAVGSSDYTLTVTDLLGLGSVDTAEVTVFDSVPPVVDAGPLGFDVDEGGSCAGVVPDLTGFVAPTDNCGPISVTQDVQVGTALTLWTTVPVTLASSDAAGNVSFTAVNVTLVDPDLSCGIPNDTSHTGIVLVTDTSDTSFSDTAQGIGGGDTSDDTSPGDTGPSGPGSDTSGDTAKRDTSGDTAVSGHDTSSDTSPPAVVDTAGDTGPTAGDTAQVVGTGDTSGDTAPPVGVVDTAGDSAAPRDTSLTTTTDSDTDTLTDSDPPATDTDGTGPNTQSDGSDAKAGSCGCANSPPGGPGVLPGILALCLLVRRRSGALAALLVCLGLGGSARAQTPIDLGVAVASNLAPGQVDQYTFTATESQRVHINGDGFATSYRLMDSYGRVLRDADLIDWRYFGCTGFCPDPTSYSVNLVGGGYLIEVYGGSGAYELFVDDAPITSSGVATTGVDLSGVVETVGGIDRYSLVLPPDSYLVGTVDVPMSVGSWRLLDAYDQVLVDVAADEGFGPLHVVGGTYSLDIENLAHQANPYRVRLESLVSRPTQFTSIGSTVTGRAMDNSVHDRWEFDATVGQRIYVQLTRGDASDNWALVDPLGTVVWSGSNDDAGDGPYVLSAGTWALEITSDSGTIQDYEIQLVDTPAVMVEPLALGVPMAQQATTVGQAVDYPFSVGAGQLVRLQNLWFQPADVSWRLTSAAGREYDLSEPDPDRVALMGGDYTLSMVPDVATPGTVRYELVPADDQVVLTTLNTNHQAAAGAGHTQYLFNVPAGQIIDIDLVGFDDFILYDALDRIIVESRLDQLGVPLMGGDYRLEFTSGSWDFDLNGAGTSAWVPMGSPVGTGVEVAGTLVPGVDDYYVLSLAAAATLFFDIHEGSYDLKWEVIDPAGHTVFALSDTGFANRGEGPFPLAAGDYTIRMHAPGGGALPYAVQVEDVSYTLDTPVALDQLYADTTTIPGEQRQYTFDLQAATDVYVEMDTGGQAVPFSMVDEVGQTLFSTEVSGALGAGPYRLDAGSYVVTADPKHNWLSDYELTIHEVLDRTEPIAVGDAVAVGFEMPGQAVTHTFTPIGPDRTRIQEHIEYEHVGGVAGLLTRFLFAKLNLYFMFCYRRWVTRSSLRTGSV